MRLQRYDNNCLKLSSPNVLRLCVVNNVYVYTCVSITHNYSNGRCLSRESCTPLLPRTALPALLRHSFIHSFIHIRVQVILSA